MVKPSRQTGMEDHTHETDIKYPVVECRPTATSDSLCLPGLCLRRSSSPSRSVDAIKENMPRPNAELRTCHTPHVVRLPIRPTQKKLTRPYSFLECCCLLLLCPWQAMAVAKSSGWRLQDALST